MEQLAAASTCRAIFQKHAPNRCKTRPVGLCFALHLQSEVEEFPLRFMVSSRTIQENSE